MTTKVDCKKSMMPKKMITEQRKTRHMMNLVCAILTIVMVLSLFSLTVWADFIEYGSGATIKLEKDTSSPLTYNFDTVFNDVGLPPEFARVYYDAETLEAKKYQIHRSNVNFYYTTGSGTDNRSIYCFEPDNPYMALEAIDRYDIHTSIPTHSKKDAISQEQRDMLAYVMAEGVTTYTDSTNWKQVATQLAIWMVGAGHYKDTGSESWMNKLLPPAGINSGIAPNTDIREEARRLLTVAYAQILEKPSFFSLGDVKMIWNGTTYTVTLIDTKGKLTASSEWGVAILAQIAAASLAATINDSEHTLTITGEPQTGGTVIPVILNGTGKKANVVFLDYIIDQNAFLHPYYTSYQSMITINTLDAAEAGQFRLVRSNPLIATAAYNAEDNTRIVKPQQNVTIIDDVEYTDLSAGMEYTLNGILIDKSTNAPILVDGLEIRSTRTFTPTQANGSVKMTFTLDTRTLAGKTIVVFEELFFSNVSIATHKEINDAKQRIEVLEVPSIITAAKNVNDNSQTVKPDETISIIDTVTYSNLIPGTVYTLNGILMNKSTGSPLLVKGTEIRSSATFTPSHKNGTIDLTFVLDARTLSDKILVIFEDLMQAGVLVASHADINDVSQSIQVLSEQPTTTRNNSSGSKSNTTTTTTSTTSSTTRSSETSIPTTSPSKTHRKETPNLTPRISDTSPVIAETTEQAVVEERATVDLDTDLPYGSPENSLSDNSDSSPSDLPKTGEKTRFTILSSLPLAFLGIITFVAPKKKHVKKIRS